MPAHRAARSWHALTALVVVGALVLQLVLVVIGNPVLADVEPPGLPARLYRYVAYFTVESNALVAWAAVTLARDPTRDGSRWRVARLTGTVAITITAVVHFLLLRPLLDLQGWDLVADKLLHVVGPALAILGWVVLGPRPRVSWRVVGLALLFPLGWMAWTLVLGAVDGWYPYPFLDPGEKGVGGVLVAAVGITVLYVGVCAAARWWDGRSARVGSSGGRVPGGV